MILWGTRAGYQLIPCAFVQLLPGILRNSGYFHAIYSGGQGLGINKYFAPLSISLARYFNELSICEGGRFFAVADHCDDYGLKKQVIWLNETERM